jgi:hypothetical protein
VIECFDSSESECREEAAFLKEMDEGIRGRDRRPGSRKSGSGIPRVSLVPLLRIIPSHTLLSRPPRNHHHLHHAYLGLTRLVPIIQTPTRSGVRQLGRNVYALSASEPDAVDSEDDYASEDSNHGTGRAKREQEREAYHALLVWQQAREESAQEEGWRVRTDVRLEKKNYRVSDLNGAMFGQWGTRVHAGNHDGRLNV